ncbi:DMT family transporter [Celeribacter naphthalenivorans]|uniref:DMT family transporter n=1 Tax=Celeribacter naphthalenivorans TaxID=1614694 RepID=UPI001CFB33D2|nr:DMT family transporter [Celeribacter naphthalenivorans]
MRLARGAPVRAPNALQQSYLFRAGLMLAAMLFYAIADSSAKALSERIDISLILFGQGVCGALLFLPVSVARGELRYVRKLLSWPVLLRNIAEFVAPFCILIAMTVTPLAIVGSLIQLQPLFVLVLAAFFLKESIGWHRWASVIVGFASVLLILRPGTEGLNIWAAIAVFGVFWLAVRDIATRLIDPTIPTMLLTAISFAVQALFGLLLALFRGIEQAPVGSDYAILGLLVFGAGLAFSLTTVVLRSGDVAAVTPFRYSRLLYTLAISVIFFGERPDVWVLVGAAMITLSGLYVFWRERRLVNTRRKRAPEGG